MASKVTKDNLPKSLNILGKSVKILIKDLSDNHGEFDGDAMEIWIDRSNSPASARQTLFHEAIHACLERSGVKYILDSCPGLEEAVVRSIENGLEDLVTFKHTGG